MKATLEFKLPKEATEHLHAVHATDWYLVAWRMHEAIWKSQHSGVETLKTEAVMETLSDIIAALGLTLD